MEVPINKKYVFIMDIDGVMTDGTFLYDETGKKYKRFGPDDADALKMIKDLVEIVFCSADHRGFPISEKRINDMGYKLNYVKTKDRLNWINEKYPTDLYFRIYMGDSFVDSYIMQDVDYSICPKDANDLAKYTADYICEYGGGNRAVSDAVFNIAETFLGLDRFDMCGIRKHEKKDGALKLEMQKALSKPFDSIMKMFKETNDFNFDDIIDTNTSNELSADFLNINDILDSKTSSEVPRIRNMDEAYSKMLELTEQMKKHRDMKRTNKGE